MHANRLQTASILHDRWRGKSHRFRGMPERFCDIRSSISGNLLSLHVQYCGYLNIVPGHIWRCLPSLGVDCAYAEEVHHPRAPAKVASVGKRVKARLLYSASTGRRHATTLRSSVAVFRRANRSAQHRARKSAPAFSTLKTLQAFFCGGGGGGISDGGFTRN